MMYLIRDSVIVQGLITLILISTVCLLWIRQQPIPQELIYMVFGVMGFYFGTKTLSKIDTVSTKMLEAVTKNRGMYVNQPINPSDDSGVKAEKE